MPVSSPHPCNFHGFDKDGIAVDFNHHHDVGVALLRTCRELARLVGEHGFVYLVCFGVYVGYHNKKFTLPVLPLAVPVRVTVLVW